MVFSLSTGLKALFLALGCAMVATLVYTISIDGSPFRQDVLTPWLSATLVDFYIHVFYLAAWIAYKESNYLTATIWIVLLICFGSIATCLYIFVQLLKLSPQESLEDPVYHVLVRHENKYGPVEKRKHSPVETARIICSLLSCLMLGTLVYFLSTDGSPFRKDILTPWMNATLVDFYINVVALSVWIAYKESNWISAILWILLLICFGSIISSLYIVQQSSQLTSLDPLYLVLLNGNDRSKKEIEVDGTTLSTRNWVFVTQLE